MWLLTEEEIREALKEVLFPVSKAEMEKAKLISQAQLRKVLEKIGSDYHVFDEAGVRFQALPKSVWQEMRKEAELENK